MGHHRHTNSPILTYGGYSVLVALSKTGGQLLYNPVSVTFITELCKLCISVVGWARAQTLGASLGLPSLVTLCVSALFYCVNNNIVLGMQVHMDPLTYQVLSNMKIPVTAVSHSIVFGRRISRHKMICLCCILASSICEGVLTLDTSQTADIKEGLFIEAWGFWLMLIHCALAGTAPVLTEWGMSKQSKVSLHVQNSVLYSAGAAFNYLALLVPHHGETNFADLSSLFHNFNFWTWAVIASQTSCGLCVSGILKLHGNWARMLLSVASTFVSALASTFVLGVRLSPWIGCLFVCVVLAVAVYYRGAAMESGNEKKRKKGEFV